MDCMMILSHESLELSQIAIFCNSFMIWSKNTWKYLFSMCVHVLVFRAASVNCRTICRLVE